MKVVEIRKICTKHCGYDKTIAYKVIGKRTGSKAEMKDMERGFSRHEHETVIQRQLLENVPGAA